LNSPTVARRAMKMRKYSMDGHTDRRRPLIISQLYGSPLARPIISCQTPLGCLPWLLTWHVNASRSCRRPGVATIMCAPPSPLLTPTHTHTHTHTHTQILYFLWSFSQRVLTWHVNASRSFRRPGVATTICAPDWMSRICGCNKTTGFTAAPLPRAPSERRPPLEPPEVTPPEVARRGGGWGVLQSTPSEHHQSTIRAPSEHHPP
jgi:hypothetical protein